MLNYSPKRDNYFKDTIDKLGIQSQEAQRMVKNQDDLLASFDESICTTFIRRSDFVIEKRHAETSHVHNGGKSKKNKKNVMAKIARKSQMETTEH